MSKKSVIIEAKADFEEITKYAQNQAIKDLEQRIKPKLQEMIDKKLQETVSIEADGASIEITDTSVEVTKSDSKVTVDMNSSTEAPTEVPSSEVETTVDSDIASEETPAEEEELMFEIAELQEEEVPEAVSNPFESIMQKLNDIEKKLEGGTAETPSAEGEVTIVDDETSPEVVAPEVAPMPEPQAAAPAPVATPEPVIQEFEMDEYSNMEEIKDENSLVKEIMKKLEEQGFSLEETNDEEMNDTLEIDVDAEDSDDAIEMPSSEEDVEFELTDDADCSCEMTDTNSIEFELAKPEGEAEIESSDEDQEIEILDSEDEDKGEEVDEMLGLGLATRRKDKTYIPHVPHKEMNESVDKIKAQYESKLDELIKENCGLKKDIKEFEESFVELRNSIDEMQTFNAKLALANKLFLNGGLSADDKLKINESLDKASTVKEARKIYDKLSKGTESIIKESKAVDRIKSKATITANGSTPSYQSQEVKSLKEGVSRYQVLAGIKKQEE